jgi:hypothetical protein
MSVPVISIPFINRHAFFVVAILLVLLRYEACHKPQEKYLQLGTKSMWVLIVHVNDGLNV